MVLLKYYLLRPEFVRAPPRSLRNTVVMSSSPQKTHHTYRCTRYCVASTKNLAERMVDAACFKARCSCAKWHHQIRAQNAVGCASRKHAKALIDGLKRIDDTRHPHATLDTLDRRIEEFKNHHNRSSFLTDLLGSRNYYVEDAVEALKTRTLTTQRNAKMKVFDEGSTFVADDDEERSREETSKEILRLYDKNGVASCLFACESDDAEELKRMIQRHDDDACEFVEDRCERCEERFSRKFRKRHEKKCPLYECECPLKCGTVLKRNQMDLHVATRCENRRAIECPYEKFGCCSPAEPITTEKTFDAHVRENCANHLFTVVTQKILPKISVVLEHEHVRIEKQLHEHLQANNRNHEKLKRFSEDDELKWTKTNFGHVETRLKAAEQSLEKERRDKLALMKRIENIETALLAKK